MCVCEDRKQEGEQVLAHSQLKKEKQRGKAGLTLGSNGRSRPYVHVLLVQRGSPTHTHTRTQLGMGSDTSQLLSLEREESAEEL